MSRRSWRNHSGSEHRTCPVNHPDPVDMCIHVRILAWLHPKGTKEGWQGLRSRGSGVCGPRLCGNIPACPALTLSTAHMNPLLCTMHLPTKVLLETKLTDFHHNLSTTHTFNPLSFSAGVVWNEDLRRSCWDQERRP